MYLAAQNGHSNVVRLLYKVCMFNLRNVAGFWLLLCTEWVKKKQDTKLLAITSLTIIWFWKFFTSRLSSKFATNSCLNIPPRFKHVATLPLWNMNAEKWHHSEIRIAINDESQGSIAKNLTCNELLYYTFIIHSVGEILRLVNIWRSYGQNHWLCHIPHSPCTFVLKDTDLAR